MPAQTAELLRALSNLIRIGTVFAMDLTARPARVRVVTGSLHTDWLPWCEARAGTLSTWWPPTVGERVIVLSPDGDPAAGVVIAGLACAASPAPSQSASEHVTLYPDGARIVYDLAAGTLSSPAFAAGLDMRPAMASNQAANSAPAIVVQGDTYTININGAELDVASLQRAVETAVRRIQSDKAARLRSAYIDRN